MFFVVYKHLFEIIAYYYQIKIHHTKVIKIYETKDRFFVFIFSPIPPQKSTYLFKGIIISFLVTQSF